MAKLKICPFCGHEPAVRSAIFGMEKAPRYGVVCQACSIAIGWEDSEEDAVRRWNRRTEFVKETDTVKDWKFVEKDGNPIAEGNYDVILIYNGWDAEKQKPNGELFATRDTRWFGDAAKSVGWVMNDQPVEGLVWTEETGSYPNERVYAWLPEREYPDVVLPEGVTWKS